MNQLSPELERKAVTEAAEMSDDVAKLAQWFCLQCEGFFPGEDLFDATGRSRTCPYCQSERIVIPERIEAR